MRIAVFSDIHGNSQALDAVLAEIDRQGGVDAYWVVGDLVAIGPDPVGVLERLERLENVSYVRGNTDRELVTGRSFISPGQWSDNPEMFGRVVEMMRNFTWTVGALDRTDWYEMFSALPVEQRLTLPDGTRMLGVHAAPGTDDGEGIHPRLSEAKLRELLQGANADLVFVGHTHWAMDVTVDGTRIVNLGSVSLAALPDTRAKFTIVSADKNGYTLEHRRVEYDRAAALEAVERSHNPGKGFILSALRGERRPQWTMDVTPEEVERLGLPKEWGIAQT